jgi:hypothetical protein
MVPSTHFDCQVKAAHFRELHHFKSSTYLVGIYPTKEEGRNSILSEIQIQGGLISPESTHPRRIIDVEYINWTINFTYRFLCIQMSVPASLPLMKSSWRGRYNSELSWSRMRSRPNFPGSSEPNPPVAFFLKPRESEGGIVWSSCSVRPQFLGHQVSPGCLMVVTSTRHEQPENFHSQ